MLKVLKELNAIKNDQIISEFVHYALTSINFCGLEMKDSHLFNTAQCLNVLHNVTGPLFVQ